VATSEADRARPRQRALRYAYSNKNIVGCLGALAGLALYLAGVVGPLWPFVVAGLYLVGALATPPPRVADLRSGLNPADLDRAMDEQLKRIAGRVPQDVFTRVLQIHSGIRDVLARREELPPGSRDAYIVEQTVLDYLPTALEGYLRLPRAYANRVVVDNGRTAQAILLDELGTLEREMRAIVAELARGDTDRLLAHERFLADRFGSRSELRLPDPADGPRPDGNSEMG